MEAPSGISIIFTKNFKLFPKFRERNLRGTHFQGRFLGGEPIVEEYSQFVSDFKE